MQTTYLICKLYANDMLNV